MITPRCDTCPYWSQNKGGGYSMPENLGTCRAEPPKLQMVPGPLADSMQLQTVFPYTPADAWCGRHPTFKEIDHGSPA